MKVIRDSKSLGELIRDERRRRNMTQVELAECAGVGINFVSQVERGKPTAELEKVLVLVSMLGLTLVGGERREWKKLSKYIG